MASEDMLDVEDAFSASPKLSALLADPLLGSSIVMANPSLLLAEQPIVHRLHEDSQRHRHTQPHTQSHRASLSKWVGFLDLCVWLGGYLIVHRR